MKDCTHVFKRIKDSSSYRTNDGTRVDVSGYYWCPKCGTLKEYHSGIEVVMPPNPHWEDTDSDQDYADTDFRLPQAIN